MDALLFILLAACVTLIAILYSSVGHGGASGYIAVMMLFGLAPEVIKPTALPRQKNEIRPPYLPVCFAAGAAIGLASGLIGVSGGIFLSPLLILSGWAGIKETAAVSSLFILVNSISGLLGHVQAVQDIPQLAMFIASAAIWGGLAGSYLGSSRLSLMEIQRTLSIVLVIAVYKVIAA